MARARYVVISRRYNSFNFMLLLLSPWVVTYVVSNISDGAVASTSPKFDHV